MGGAPRSRRLAQPSAERGATDPRRPGVARFPGKTLLLLSSISLFSCLFLAAQCSLVSVCQRQELEHRARDKYSAFDQMSAELRQLREQQDALDALAEALRTQDGWLSYRVEALRDQLLEHEGQAAARPPAIERICTALIDWDEALQQARGVWRRCAPWRPTGRWRCRRSGPRTRRSARGSWRRNPSRAGPRRGRGRLIRGPRRPSKGPRSPRN
jgi:hypothetical protein